MGNSKKSPAFREERDFRHLVHAQTMRSFRPLVLSSLRASEQGTHLAWTWHKTSGDLATALKP